MHEPHSDTATRPAHAARAVLGWPALLAALLVVGTSAAQHQALPAIGTAGRMNVAPVTFLQPAPMPVDKDKGKEPPPRADRPDPLGDRPRLRHMGEKLGATPRPSAEDLKDYEKFVEKFIDPRNTLDVVEGRTRLMILKQAPTKIQVADEKIASANPLEPRQISILGVRVGTTVLNLYFEDAKDRSTKVLSYLVRVLPDPEGKARLEAAYKALEKEINDTFCNSQVRLSLVGDKLVVAGQARDIFEGTQIIRLVRANAPGDRPLIPVGNLSVEVRPEPGNPNASVPGLSDFLTAGGPNIVNLLRVPGEQQVMLKVTVAEVNRSAARSIGLNFNVINNQGLTVFGQRTGNIAVGGSGAIQGLGGFGGVGGVGGIGGVGANLGGLAAAGLITNNLPVNLDGGQIPVAINALRELNYARSLAEPNLVAMNGQTASFQAGGQFPVPVVSSSGGGLGGALQGVNYVPYGVQLTFTPFITSRDRIRLQVQANVSTRDLGTGANVGGSGVPGLNTRNFNTTVELREGQTLAVAGLIQNNLASQADRVPGIGDLPLLSRLFGYDRIQSGEQELIVLITPELVHPLDKTELLPLPGSDLLEPSDLEFYVLGRLESKRGEDYRSSVRNSLGRMKAYHTLESTYLFGPSGLTDPPAMAPAMPGHPASSYAPLPTQPHGVPAAPGGPDLLPTPAPVTPAPAAAAPAPATAGGIRTGPRVDQRSYRPR